MVIPDVMIRTGCSWRLFDILNLFAGAFSGSFSHDSYRHALWLRESVATRLATLAGLVRVILAQKSPDYAGRGFGLARVSWWLL